MSSDTLQKAREYEEQYAPFIPAVSRPAFHLTPRIGWMSYPNGFSVYQNRYHLFYQYHPFDTRPGSMHWGHAVSTDLLRWEYLPCALAPDKPYDKGGGCFSGSAIELPDGRHLLLYTGVRSELQEDGTRREVQTQCIAIGDGRDYQKFSRNPVLDEINLPTGGSRFDFRDPKIWQEEDSSYACVIANRSADGSGSVLLYRSRDAMHWKFDRMIDQCYNEFGRMWECPDFFLLDNKEVLLVSPLDMSPSGLEFHNGSGTLCIIGRYNSKKGIFEREHMQAIDYGLDFYATQTLLSPDGRRIMIAWMQNKDACMSLSREQRWFGQMCIPRELSVRGGRLIQNPVRELEQYRGRRVYHKVLLGEEASLQGVSGRILDMTIRLLPNKEDVYQIFRIKVASGSQYYTAITYTPRTSVLRVDRSHSGFCRDWMHERKCQIRSRQGDIKIRVILDRFSVEIFVNDGEQALSTVIYTPQNHNGISFEIQGQAFMEVEKYDLLFPDSPS